MSVFKVSLAILGGQTQDSGCARAVDGTGLNRLAKLELLIKGITINYPLRFNQA